MSEPMDKQQKKLPNPGTKEALDLGCTCPIMDNAHGKGIPLPNKKGEIEYCFWYSGDCPVHVYRKETGGNAG